MSDFELQWRFMDKSMTEQRTLLAEYAETGSEEAFREVVSSYIHLVYSSAMRLVDGDCHRAEDVAQTVFTDLARRAGSLSAEVMLGGWLHRRTCHIAATLMRSERRRQRRERQAAEVSALNDNGHPWFEEIAPILDEAINQLSAPDRTAIVLRFFDGRDLRSVGLALATNEDAAQKRVSRALEKLRGLLLSRGVSASAVALAGALSASAVSAAPAGLAASISTAALAGATATSTGVGLVLLKVMAMTKIKIAVGAVLAAGVGAGLVVQHQEQVMLRAENRGMQEQVEQFEKLRAENQQLADALARSNTQEQESQLAELDRLRRELARLRQQTGKPKAALAQQNPKNGTLSKDYFTRDSYAFAGFADPDSTLQTMMWAGSTSDATTILNCFPPEAKKDELRTKAQEEKAVEAVSRSTSRWSSFRILERQRFGEDRMVLTIFYEAADGGSEVGRMKLRRVGAEWKFDGDLNAGRPLQPGQVKWGDGVTT